MLQIISRLKHHAKVFVGSRLERFLFNRYFRGKGPASRLISISSDEPRTTGLDKYFLVAAIPLKKLAPNYLLKGKIETEYKEQFLSGENFTSRAGIISASNADVSFPTSMHLIGNLILDEAILTPLVLTNPKYYFGLETMRLKRKRQIDEGILLSMPFYHNFYHWLIEILPRLISYDRCPSLHHVPLIVPKSAPDFVTESLKLTGYLSKTVFLENGTYRFKKLHMLSKLSPMLEVSPDAIEWLNTKFKGVKSDLRSPRKLYVSRSDAKIRFVSNEAQFSDILKEFGFETLSMSGLSIPDQIEVFRNAEFIMGPHGAAFANLAFAKSGATLIEFFSRGHYAPCFNRISSIRGMRYGFLVGEPTRIGGFSISPSHLRMILSQVLQSEPSAVL